ncbi:hypothetical protein LJC48_01430 [Desulfovibrio sp. OttesenSCG-928-C06]|nr:hypothetical protein [Desulfovibrio sp. OttesenSCG-928-C06]
MIPCFICGQNAETGWIQGFPPAPDSQKLGLCPRHNTRDNRNKVKEAWQDFMRSSIGTHARNEAFRSAATPHILKIFFIGGGTISVPCMDVSTPDKDLLKVITPEAEAVFFPLRQVLRYSISPVSAAEATETIFAKTTFAESTDESARRPATARTVNVEIIPDETPALGTPKSLPENGTPAQITNADGNAASTAHGLAGQPVLPVLPVLEDALRKLPPKVFASGQMPKSDQNMPLDEAVEQDTGKEEDEASNTDSQEQPPAAQPE